MKKNCSSTEDVIRAPSYPHSGRQLFGDLRAALTSSFGFHPGFGQLGRMIGANASLTHYWFKSLSHRHVIAFLCLLERLPESSRSAWLDAHCRELPCIDHPRLAHDALAVAALENVLREEKGVTWVQGGTEFHQTFLITALGHSVRRIRGERAIVTGLDIHEPRKFVPVETVLYLREPLPLSQAANSIRAAWPEIRSANASLVLLNGIWPIMPELRGEILKLAADRHILVTVPRLPSLAAARTKMPTRVITVNSPGESDGLIRLKVEAL